MWSRQNFTHGSQSPGPMGCSEFEENWPREKNTWWKKYFRFKEWPSQCKMCVADKYSDIKHQKTVGLYNGKISESFSFFFFFCFFSFLFFSFVKALISVSPSRGLPRNQGGRPIYVTFSRHFRLYFKTVNGQTLDYLITKHSVHRFPWCLVHLENHMGASGRILTMSFLKCVFVCPPACRVQKVGSRLDYPPFSRHAWFAPIL